MNGTHGQGFASLVDEVVYPESERKVDWAAIGCDGVAEKVKHYTHFRITGGGGSWVQPAHCCMHVHPWSITDARGYHQVITEHAGDRGTISVPIFFTTLCSICRCQGEAASVGCFYRFFGVESVIKIRMPCQMSRGREGPN